MTGNASELRIWHSKDVIYSIALIFSVVLTLGAGGFAYRYYRVRADYGTVYAQLGIAPLSLATAVDSRIQARLDQLRREPCYRDAVVALADALLEAGYPRDADTGLANFARRCGESNETLARRHKALSMASDFSAALGIADELVKSDPGRATYRYMRAETYEKIKDFERALMDYINSLQLLGTPSRVAGYHFYDISRMYAALGRHCDAITPIETYVAFDPATRGTMQTTAMIAEYSSRGNCSVSHARENVRMPMTGGAGVQTISVTVNGVSGNFILDTGASYVSVTAPFSAKAKINTNTAAQLPIKTVGGTVQAELGSAATVAVGGAEARNVVVAVIRGAHDPFGARIDGLLGMSFLARFNVHLLPNRIELTAAEFR